MGLSTKELRLARVDGWLYRVRKVFEASGRYTEADGRNVVPA
jgi:hypothetical protein